MATYSEIFDLNSNSALRNRISVAVTVKAKDYIKGATPSSNQLTWAKQALSFPEVEAEKLLRFMLADNNGLTTTQIQNATDSSIQTGVNTAVDALVGGEVI